MAYHPPHLHAEAVMAVVLEALNVQREDLIGIGRHPRVVLARRVCVYIMRHCTILSFPEIGHAINPGRSHSSIVTMYQAVERAMDVVPKHCQKSPRQLIAELLPVCEVRVGFTKSKLASIR